MNFLPTKARGWLATDTPHTRLQAKLGAVYRLVRRFLLNPMGVIGLILVAIITVTALLAPWLPLADPIGQSLGDRLLAPSGQHPMGTDTLGRDILARVVYGARPTLAIIALVLLISAPVGLIIGAAAGLWGGWTDTILMRLADVFLAFPRLILAIAIAAALTSGLWTAVIAIALTGWPPYARVARSEASASRHAEFIQGARSMGVSRLRLLLRHAVPLCLPSAIVRAALDAPGIVIIVAGLGFLGVGLPPPAPEWGAMVSEGRSIVYEAWWVSTIPGVMILLLSLGFNFFGDALRDVIDPGVK